MPKPFSPNATKLLKHFHERELITAAFILPEELGKVLPNPNDCIAAIHELTGAGWMMVDPKSPGPVPRAALSDFGFKMLHYAAAGA